jgi:hypothetical protein
MDNQLRKSLRKLIKEGKTKREVYREFRSNVDDELLRKTLASIPSLQGNGIMLAMHRVVCFIWIVIFLFELVVQFDQFYEFDLMGLISFAITSYLLFHILKFHGDHYLPSIIWMVWGGISIGRDMFSLKADDVDIEIMVPFFQGILIVNIAVVLMMITIRKHVFGYYYWFKPYLDQHDRVIFDYEN